MDILHRFFPSEGRLVLLRYLYQSGLTRASHFWAFQRRNQATKQVRHCHRNPPLGLSASAKQLSAEPRSLLDRPCSPVPRRCRSLIAPIRTFAVGCWGSFGHLPRGFSTSESTALEPILFHFLSQHRSYRTRVCGDVELKPQQTAASSLPPTAAVRPETRSFHSFSLVLLHSSGRCFSFAPGPCREASRCGPVNARRDGK